MKKNKIISKHKYSFKEKLYYPEIFRGIAVSLKHFWGNFKYFGFSRKERKFTDTLEYPEEKLKYPEIFRGKHRLMKRDDGSLRCVACMMCATACPAECIYIEAEDTKTEIEKKARVFVIDELRCVFCGLCVEACPTDAIRMDTKEHVQPEYSREAFVYDMDKLLENAGRSIAIQGGKQSQILQ